MSVVIPNRALFTYPRTSGAAFRRAVDIARDSGINHPAAYAAQAEAEARIAVGHDDYEAFEAEFMRIVESEAARKIIEEGL